MSNHNPAASHDFGTWCWGMGEPVVTAMREPMYMPDDFVIDEVTARLGFDRIEASYERYLERQIEAHLENMGLS